MLLPLGFILVAFVSAALVAYGGLAHWGQFENGLDVILLTRRLQWPLLLLSLAACLGLIGVVVGGKRRIWWLIGLLPVLALFYRWVNHGASGFVILDSPAFVTAEEAAQFIGDDDYVVGLLLGDTHYAYPHSALFATPVVVQPEQGRRMMLMWSPYANLARAFMIGRELKPREMDVVGMPGNALHVYDTRHGQFINGLTGLTPAGEPPIGLGMPISTSRMKWGHWRALHPQTKALAPTGRERRSAARPLAAAYRLPGVSSELPAGTRIAILDTMPAVAIPAHALTAQPENLIVGNTPVLLFRDEASGQLRAFHREIDEQLTPRFKSARNARNPAAILVDSDTGCGWDRDGVAVEGDRARRGQKLLPIAVEDDLDWGVMKYWNPDLSLQEVAEK